MHHQRLVMNVYNGQELQWTLQPMMQAELQKMISKLRLMMSYFADMMHTGEWRIKVTVAILSAMDAKIKNELSMMQKISEIIQECNFAHICKNGSMSITKLQWTL